MIYHFAWPLPQFDRTAETVFFLSTGRTGTTYLADYLGAFPGYRAVHEPKPRYFTARTQLYLSDNPESNRWRKLVAKGRAKVVNSTWKSGNVYVESSPFLSFFAPALVRSLPKSRFIYIYRHPGAIVRSGMRRHWYAGHPNDVNRLVPRPGSDVAARWPEMSAFEKICWYWAEYNDYCLRCAELIPANQLLSLSFEEVFESEKGLEKIKVFLSLPPIGEATSLSLGNVRTNAQKSGEFPKYSEWSSEKKATLLRYAEKTMARLGYGLD